MAKWYVDFVRSIIHCLSRYQVMIVNVNPFETSYDENLHAMKFASLTREVMVNPAPAATHTIGKTVGKTIKKLGPMTLSHPDLAPNKFTRKVTLSIGGQGNNKKPTDRVVSIVEGIHMILVLKIIANTLYRG
jgi:kinesin family member 20